MKKIILPLFFLIISSPLLAQQKTIQFSTYIAPPINTFSRLILTTQGDPDAFCTDKPDGTTFLDNVFDLHVCWGNAPKENLSPWILDESTNIIYLREGDTNENINVGIGTDTPTQRLHLIKENTITQPGTFNSMTMNPADTQDNFGTAITVGGVPINALNHNYSASLSFLVGKGATQKTAEIYYMDRSPPSVNTGIWFNGGGAGNPDIWLDSSNGNFKINGSNLPAPTYKLQIEAGNIKTDSLFLTFDGGNSAALKAVRGSDGNFYAELY